jgi:GntR family transcriptional regulator, arabinose operon transcriptional repressor
MQGKSGLKGQSTPCYQKLKGKDSSKLRLYCTAARLVWIFQSNRKPPLPGKEMRSPQDHKRRPKHLEIKHELHRAIDQGEYVDGQRIPTEVELARKFGVSRPTMARALRDLEQDGKLQRRAGAGTYVRLTKRCVFGLLIREVGEIFEPICHGLSQAREDTPHELIWGNVPDNLSAAMQAQRLCEQYVERKVSGVFWSPLELTENNEAVNWQIAETFNRARIPVVLLDRDIYSPPRRSNFDLVGIDNRRAGYVLAEHLLKLGCKNIVFLARPHSAPTVDARISGFREALFSRGFAARPELIQLGDPADTVFVRQFVETTHADGIVCANDLTAAKVMRTLTELGIPIPGQIRIVGVDDVKFASLVSVPLTTLHQPCRDMGVAALDAMLERIKHPQAPGRDILLNFQLIVRQSCGAKLKPEQKGIPQRTPTLEEGAAPLEVAGDVADIESC